jgi:hypothetical protein
MFSFLRFRRFFPSMEWTDTRKRAADKGAIALQVHGSGDFTRQFVRYRNIHVKPLDR